MPSNLEVSNSTASGFFAANYIPIPNQQYIDWIEPGDNFYRVRAGLNADRTHATVPQITAAVAIWEALTLCQRYRIRLHHEASLRRKHATLKVWLYYVTHIPTSAVGAVRLCLDNNEFDYLGQTFSAARTKIIGLQSLAFWLNFFPSNVMDQLVFGYEGDAA